MCSGFTILCVSVCLQFFVVKAVENDEASFLEFVTTGTTYEPKGDV